MTAPATPPEGRRPDRAAFAIAAGLAVLAGVIAWNAGHLGRGGAYSPVGPTTFPYMIAAALALLAVGTAVSAWRGSFPTREPEASAPVLWIVAGLAAQMLLLRPAGFSVATGLLFALTAKGFGRGPLWMTVPVGIVFSFLVWLLFSRGLQLTLPAGPLERLI